MSIPNRPSSVLRPTGDDGRPVVGTRHRLWRPGLDHPGRAFATIGPNWFASVMGTGIVGTAAVTLPVQIPGLRVFATAVWLLAASLLVVLTAVWAVHWVRHTERARAHASNPVMAQFWGAVAMAPVTVGAGALLLGVPLLGPAVAVATSWTLWSIGTALGLVTTVWIPYLMITRHEIGTDAAVPGWLMPVVPPMVSAADGALLVGHMAPGAGRQTMLLACYALFGISLFATLVILPQIWNRLVVHGVGPATTVPTLWIVLGPLGQSVTAANLLADQAPGVLPEPYATGTQVIGLLYGVPAWGFAIVWMALAAAVTIRTARAGMPFALTWWSFTFPVGTVVTGTSVLAARTHLPVFVWGAVGLYVLLVAAWVTVAARTARGGLVRGHMSVATAPGASHAAG